MTAPAGGRPAAGEVEAVAPGLLRITVLLPGPPSHVNCWLIEDGAGWLLVDTGLDDEATRAVWRRVFAGALGGRPVTRVLVTHFHPDHVGLAGWLCAEWGAPLLMPRSEWQRARLLLLDDPAATVTAVVGVQRLAGAPPEHLRRLEAEGARYGRVVAPLPPAFRPLADGQVIRTGERRWTVRMGPGHAPEMALLHDAENGVLLSADHVLPRITPHVGLQPSEVEGDPLGDFLASLRRFRALPAPRLVLPSHGEPFGTLHARVDALLEHHRAGLARLSKALADGRERTAAELVPALFGRPFDGRPLTFALAETLSHLRRLEEEGRLRRATGPDGAWRFAPAPAGAAQMRPPPGPARNPAEAEGTPGGLA